MSVDKAAAEGGRGVLSSGVRGFHTLCVSRQGGGQDTGGGPQQGPLRLPDLPRPSKALCSSFNCYIVVELSIVIFLLVLCMYLFHQLLTCLLVLSHAVLAMFRHHFIINTRQCVCAQEFELKLLHTFLAVA